MILAFPIGSTKSIYITDSSTVKVSPYIISFSKKTTGFGFLIAIAKFILFYTYFYKIYILPAFNNPLASITS
jgi:hypothetical protein